MIIIHKGDYTVFFNLSEKRIDKQGKRFAKIVQLQKETAEKEYRANRINQKYCFQKEYPNMPELPGHEVEWTEKDKFTFFLAGKIQHLLDHAEGQNYEDYVKTIRRNESDGTIVRVYMKELSLLSNNLEAISAGIMYYQGDEPTNKITIPSKKEFKTKMENERGALSLY